jgi:hypothetical protein
MPMLIMSSDRTHLKLNTMLPFQLVLQPPEVKLHVVQAKDADRVLVNEELIRDPNLVTL